MNVYTLDAELWQHALGKPYYFQTADGLVALAFCLGAGKRVPDKGFSAHSGPEAFFVVSGEVQLVTESGKITVPEGSLGVVSANEKHFTRNQGDKQARLISFTPADGHGS